MKCKELNKRWEDWLSDDAPPGFEQHLRVCRRCQGWAEGLARTSEWMSALRLEPPEPGPAFWARLRERLQESERGPDVWTELSLLAGRAAVALAVLVLLLAFWVLGQAPAPSAVAAFDAPQTYLEAAAGPLPPVNGQWNRDQVVLTLVVQPEGAERSDE